METPVFCFISASRFKYIILNYAHCSVSSWYTLSDTHYIIHNYIISSVAKSLAVRLSAVCAGASCCCC